MELCTGIRAFSPARVIPGSGPEQTISEHAVPRGHIMVIELMAYRHAFRNPNLHALAVFVYLTFVSSFSLIRD